VIAEVTLLVVVDNGKDVGDAREALETIDELLTVKLD
jgi:hypothetical protein